MDKLILITNDDGYQAQGIQELTRLMQTLGKVVVVAPSGARSGAACSITPTRPVSIERISDNVYACDGTPVDCVKIALEKILTRHPDLVVSGINHGDNASVSLHYSGTMGAALEACMKGLPAIGYSLKTRNKKCDFSPYYDVIQKWAEYVLENGLPQDTLLNINFPEVQQLQGECLCRMARGAWDTEWAGAGQDGSGKKLYTLTGCFHNLEPDAEDTDYWALEHGYASITPLQLDMTSHTLLQQLPHL